MARYDRGFGPRRQGGGYDRQMSAWWGYDREYGWEGTRGPNAWWGQERGGGGGGGGGDLGYGWGGGRERTYGAQGGGYDRGVYGGSYPQYGGYPGDDREGMHYGRRRGAWQGAYGPGEGQQGGGSVMGRGGAQDGPDVGIPRYPARYDSGYMGGYTRGYDRGFITERTQRTLRYGDDFAREPFMPEAAYLRHPEYETPPTYHQQRWEQPGRYVIEEAGEQSDDEIEQEVRQRLYQDTWLHADDIEVEVNEGVVTLRGEVNDFLEARYAWDDAWETDGVRGVINNLTVRPDAAEHHGDMFAQDAGDGDKAGNG